uniref:C2H2-type domain-containing protein n=1 Tax=Terrapene triunguis TaxID=2587831 RepID=A0A674J514_9SAUR
MMEVVWESDNDTCDTGEEHSDDSSHSSERVGRKSSLQLEVDLDYSQPCSPGCSPAGPSGRQELPVELQCEDEETYETYYQKRGETTAGVFVTSNTNFDLQCENEDLEFYSSEELQGGLSEDDEKIILVDAFDEEDLEPITGEALSYRCKKCGASFHDLGELQEHNQIHLTENSYQCPILCGKGFRKPNLLSRHKVIHRQDKPHKCQECGKHQQIHSGERPFYCEECGRTFTQLVTLQCHQRIHTGEKPYSCAYCGRRFTVSATLRKHERTHKVDKSNYPNLHTQVSPQPPSPTMASITLIRKHCLMRNSMISTSSLC